MPDDLDIPDGDDDRPRRRRRKDKDAADWSSKFIWGEKPERPESISFLCPECSHVWNPRKSTLSSSSVRCPMCRTMLAVQDGRAVTMTPPSPNQPTSEKPSKARTCLGCAAVIVVGSIVAACAGS